jgi:hypothetical protein
VEWVASDLFQSFVMRLETDPSECHGIRDPAQEVQSLPITHRCCCSVDQHMGRLISCICLCRFRNTHDVANGTCLSSCKKGADCFGILLVAFVHGLE